MSTMSHEIALLLWQASWQAVGVIVCGKLLATALPGAQHRARLLHGTLLCCLFVPVVSALVPHYILLPRPLPQGIPLVEPADAGTMPYPSAARIVSSVVLVAWLIGFVFHVARIVYGWVSVRQVIARSVPVKDHRIEMLVERIGSVQGLDIRSLPLLGSPFCWQIHRPVMVIPESLLACSDEDLELLLRHEIAHLRAGDPLKLFVEHCLMALFWFHPLVRRASAQSQCWREVASDDWALAAGGSPIRLGQLLTDLAAQTIHTRSGAWQLSAYGSTRELHFRLQRLVGERQSHERSAIVCRGAFALLALAALVLAIGRLAGPFQLPRAGVWTHWPTVSGQLLDLAGIQVIDFDLRRAAHDPREQSPEHRAAHRRWKR